MPAASLPRRRAAAYRRVSTIDQAVEGLSLESQEVRLRAYCEAHRLELTEVVTDPGVSGGRALDSRPGGRRLAELVTARAVDVICSIRLDRLFRDAADCLAVTREWETAGVSLHLIDLGGQPVDTSSSMGRFFLTVMAAAAEMQRTQQAEKILATYAWERRESRRPGNQRAFGFRTERGPDRRVRFVPDEQAHLARAAIEQYVAGEAIAAIARWLTERCPGREWTPTGVRSMVVAPVYAGLLSAPIVSPQYLRWTEPATNVVPIVSVDLWRAAVARRDRTRGESIRPRPKVRLSGAAICGSCGANATYVGNNQIRYWRCSRAQRKLCGEGGIREDVIWPILRAAVLDLTEPERVAARAAERSEEDHRRRARQAEIEERLNRLTDLYTSSSTMTVAELDRLRQPLLDELEAMRDTSPRPSPLELLSRDELAAVIDAMDPLEQGELLRAFGLIAVLRDRRVAEIRVCDRRA